MNTLIGLDHRAFRLINDLHCAPVDWLMLVTTTLGEYGAVWLLVAAVIFFADKKQGRGMALLLLGALFLSLLIDNELLKRLCYRERPYQYFDGVHRLGKLWQNNSFPSGHASSAVAAAIVLGRYYKRLVVPLAVFAVLTIYSRPYLGMHFPLDVLAGALSGACAGCLALNIARRRKGDRVR